MPEIKKTTILFPIIKNENGTINQIWLAMKKRGFGVGKWNGVGGKLNVGESFEEAAKREANEEICIEVVEMKKAAEITFKFEDGNGVYSEVFLCEKWNSLPIESEEMNPRLFKIDEVPYNEMWSDDKYWLPLILKQEIVKAEFEFDKENNIISQNIDTIKSF